MELANLALILGALSVGVGVYGVIQTERLSQFAKGFARSVEVGYVLMGISTAWFVYNLSLESIADFAAYKDKLLLGFAALGVLTCVYVKDYLGARGLAVLLLLVANEMVNAARWEDTIWRLVITTWGYAFAIAGMWFTIAPWRVRDLIDWSTRTQGRLKKISVARIVFGAFVIALGMTAFRGVETP